MPPFTADPSSTSPLSDPRASSNTLNVMELANKNGNILKIVAVQGPEDVVHTLSDANAGRNEKEALSLFRESLAEEDEEGERREIGAVEDGAEGAGKRGGGEKGDRGTMRESKVLLGKEDGSLVMVLDKRIDRTAKDADKTAATTPIERKRLTTGNL
ncbi:hypothetical protein VTL71DRAFT_9212 [Oculimacula yallundae]|uniref:Uncharacterized protein n=1 Tax=Oculimacula yallundae TaxID=86028 RepID=A0ABR4BTZ1_9HELO